jgi:hypothetical protein
MAAGALGVIAQVTGHRIEAARALGEAASLARSGELEVIEGWYRVGPHRRRRDHRLENCAGWPR